MMWCFKRHTKVKKCHQKYIIDFFQVAFFPSTMIKCRELEKYISFHKIKLLEINLHGVRIGRIESDVNFRWKWCSSFLWLMSEKFWNFRLKMIRKSEWNWHKCLSSSNILKHLSFIRERKKNAIKYSTDNFFLRPKMKMRDDEILF